jgi:hypothetical protein
MSHMTDNPTATHKKLKCTSKDDHFDLAIKYLNILKNAVNSVLYILYLFKKKLKPTSKHHPGFKPSTRVMHVRVSNH